MSANAVIRNLLRLANKIAAAHPPHQRQSHPRNYPEIARMGLARAYNQFPEDLQTLGRHSENKQLGLSRRPPHSIETGDPVNVFISHKAEDATTARSIKKIMEVYAAGRFSYFRGNA